MNKYQGPEQLNRFLLIALESVFAYWDNQQSQSHSITDTNHKLIEEGLVGKVLLEHADVLEDGLDDGVDVPLTVVGQLHRHQHQAEPEEKMLLHGNNAKNSKSHPQNLPKKRFFCMATATTTITTTKPKPPLQPGPEEGLLRYDNNINIQQ